MFMRNTCSSAEQWVHKPLSILIKLDICLCLCGLFARLSAVRLKWWATPQRRLLTAAGTLSSSPLRRRRLPHALAPRLLWDPNTIRQYHNFLCEVLLHHFHEHTSAHRKSQSALSSVSLLSAASLRRPRLFLLHCKNWHSYLVSVSCFVVYMSKHS